ncbi:DUF2461 family protein [Sediminibacterium sp.]|uniref:DUF2461 family protein n=1 Tax=Sediminibacterium sp. TaxID=1917865 RepID=UPI003F6E6DFB
MLQKTTLSFLKELKKNNTKEWFYTNRKKYEAAKADFSILSNSVIQALGKKDPFIASLQMRIKG